MGSLMVLMNTDNPAVAAALADPGTKEAGFLLSAVEADFVADLVGRALEDDLFGESDGPEDDDDFSVGALVRALIRSRLTESNESVGDAMVRLRDLRRRDPSLFRASVQHGVHFPRSTGR
jgi:hypothetical protein